MQAQADYKFKMLLKYKMARVGGRLIDCDKEYTSKSCSSCGEIKHDLSGSSTYTCSSCHIVLDRDVNAAKNIIHMKMGCYERGQGLCPFINRRRLHQGVLPALVGVAGLDCKSEWLDWHRN